MKLSNKILIGFFGFILLYMLAAFTEIRFRGIRNGLEGSDTKVESVRIDTVRYLVLPDLDQRITVSVSNEPRIESRSISGNVLQKLAYEINGDTLILKQFDLDEQERVNLFIYVAENDLAVLEANESTVIIKNLDQSSLSITQSGGLVRMEGNNKLGNMRITASEKARFNAAGFGLDTLSIQMNNSTIKCWSSVERLEGAMINESHLVVKNPGDIQFKKDEGSRLQLVN